MKPAILLLCICALTIGVNGQAGVTPDATWKTGVLTVGPGPMVPLPEGGKRTMNQLSAKTVEIRIGNTVITADAAEVKDWKGSIAPVDIVLTGNVHVRTVLDPTQR